MRACRRCTGRLGFGNKSGICRSCKTCRKCGVRVGANNRSGLCLAHHERSGRCKDCWKPCSRKSKRCARCFIERSQDRAKTVGPCSATGCERRTKSACGLCRWHRDTHRPCQVEGCAARVSYYSTTGLCRPHLIVAYNKARNARRAAAREKAKATKRRRAAKGKR